MKHLYSIAGIKMPVNEQAHVNDTDKLYRKLDCAVIQFMHSEIKKLDEKQFDTVRGVFLEGDELYPSAGFKDKNHIQLCVRNPNCIKGYFRPLENDSSYPSV